MEKHAIRFILPDNKPSNPFSTVSLAEIELTMGDWQSYRKDTAFHHIGAVGGIFMVSDATKRPDPAAMERIFARHPYSPEGTILRLAWLQGLSRAEIVNLAWQQVDFENRVIILEKRTVPIEENTLICLSERFKLYGNKSAYVVTADRKASAMPPESVSRAARIALNEEGISASLKDLRQDYVRRQLQERGMAYAAKVSGMAVATLRGVFPAELQPETLPKTGTLLNQSESEFLLWRIVQAEGESAVGLALWMCWKLLMQPGEIIALTWDQVDLESGILHLSNRDVMMGSRLSRLMGDVYKKQAKFNEPRIFVAPSTGHPMDISRLTVLCQTALIRGGLGDVDLRTLYTWAVHLEGGKTLISYAKEHGFLTRENAMELLHISKATAWRQLMALQESQQLIRIGTRYFPPESIVPPEEQYSTVINYIKEHGTAQRRELTELLNIVPTQATYILRNMVSDGKLILDGKRYRLPPPEP